MDQVLILDQIVEHAFIDYGDGYTSDKDTSIQDPFLVDTCGVMDTIVNTGYKMVRNGFDNASPRELEIDLSIEATNHGKLISPTILSHSGSPTILCHQSMCIIKVSHGFLSPPFTNLQLPCQMAGLMGIIPIKISDLFLSSHFQKSTSSLSSFIYNS